MRGKGTGSEEPVDEGQPPHQVVAGVVQPPPFGQGVGPAVASRLEHRFADDKNSWLNPKMYCPPSILLVGRLVDYTWSGLDWSNMTPR